MADHIHIARRGQLYTTPNSLRMPLQHAFSDLHANLPVLVPQGLLCLCFGLAAVYTTCEVAEAGKDSSSCRRRGRATRCSELVYHTVEYGALRTLVYPRLSIAITSAQSIETSSYLHGTA